MAGAMSSHMKGRLTAHTQQQRTQQHQRQEMGLSPQKHNSGCDAHDERQQGTKGARSPQPHYNTMRAYDEPETQHQALV